MHFDFSLMDFGVGQSLCVVMSDRNVKSWNFETSSAVSYAQLDAV